MSSTRVAPEEPAPRIHPRPSAPPPTMAALLEATMKGVTSNHFLRSENKPGDWASGQETLTFNQAYEQAVCFAVATARHGIGPGKRVGVYCSNGVEYTLAILGCHLSGAAAVIREPDMPIGELVAVTRATKPHLVLLTDGAAGDATAAEFVAKMAELPGAEMRKVVPWWTHAIEKDDGCDTTLLMRCGAPSGVSGAQTEFPGRWPVGSAPAVHFGDSLLSEIAAFTPPALAPETVAVICMTSGTTGKPKGVMHTQGGLAWMCGLMDDMWYNPQTLGPRVPGDCVPSVLTFQSGYISGYLVVAAAATLHLQMTFAETEELRLWLRTQGWPTEASPVVQMLLPAVITTIWKKAGKKTEKGAGKWLYGQLRRARAKYVEGNSYEAANGGAISGCPAKIANAIVGKKIRKALGGRCRLMVTGGAKPDLDMLKFFWTCGLPIYEGFVSTEVLLALLNTPPKRCLGTAGAPPAGVEIKLTDANEICVRSPMGTIGYFENPQVTADSFDAEGFFKTGDQGEWYKAKDGVEYIRITGRIKDMIILHGDNYRGDENLWPETLEGIFKRATCIADCVIPPSCEHPERFHLVMLVALDEAAAAFTDAEIAAAIAEVGAAAGIQAHEYPLQFVRIPEALTKENGFRNANHKLMRKKIDDHYKAEIDAAFAVDRTKIDVTWVPK